MEKSKSKNKLKIVISLLALGFMVILLLLVLKSKGPQKLASQVDDINLKTDKAQKKSAMAKASKGSSNNSSKSKRITQVSVNKSSSTTRRVTVSKGSVDYKSSTNKLAGKTKIKKREKVYKYAKRFVQIDSEIDKYNFISGMVAVKNTARNRSRYPSALVRSEHLLVKTKKKIRGDSIVQNKSTKSYGVFNRIINFKTQKDMEKQVGVDLRSFRYRNKNELSMINNIYTLEFSSAKDASVAYSQIKKLSYVLWSSIDVLEYEKIN